MTHPTHTHYEQCVTFNFFPSQQHEIVYNLFCLTMLYMAPLLMIILSYGAIVVTIVQKTRLSADGECKNHSILLNTIIVCYCVRNIQFHLFLWNCVASYIRTVTYIRKIIMYIYNAIRIRHILQGKWLAIYDCFPVQGINWTCKYITQYLFLDVCMSNNF